jgi:hypothetical protein
VAIQIKRRVWIGALIACAAVAGWAFWTRNALLVPQVAVAPVAPKPFVQLANTDQTLREKADLLDPTPLFFPTERNYGQRSLPQSALKQPGQVFGSFEPKLTVADQNIAPYRNETTPVPEKLSDVLAQGNEAPFAGMGQVDLQTPTLPIRSGYLEVSDLKNGDIIISQALSGLNAPRPDFAPMEFLVVVGAAGVVGDPFLMSGSGGEEMDNFLRSYLVKSYRLGERLRPGRYRVLVGA